MDVLVDTSVWSLALRRDTPSESRAVEALPKALDGDADVYVTGIVLQELLQGFLGTDARQSINDRFSSLPSLVPDTSDHIEAADLRNRCRRKGIQIGTMDALIAQLSIRYKLTLLTTDNNFKNMSRIIKLKLS